QPRVPDPRWGLLRIGLVRRHERHGDFVAPRRRRRRSPPRFRTLCPRLDRRRRREARGGHSAMARLRSSSALRHLRLGFRRRTDHCGASVSAGAPSGPASRRAPLPVGLASEPGVQRLHRKEGGVPYGIALAAAALAIYPDTPWMAFAM